MTQITANPMICRSGMPLHWRVIESDNLWHAELGVTGVLTGKVRWERVGAPKTNKEDAEATAVRFALTRVGKC